MNRAALVVDSALDLSRHAARLRRLGKPYIRELARGTQATDAEERAEYIELWAVQAGESLKDPDLLWVSDEMANIVTAAESGMPDHAYLPAALPWKNCFCLVEQGIRFSADRHGRMVKAVHWTKAGTRLLCSMFEEYKGHLYFMMMVILVEGQAISTATDGREEGTIPGRWLACLWLLLQQKIAVRERRAVPRAVSRRWVKEQDTPLPAVIELVLRRPAPHESDGAGKPVDWSHRWIVGGHWRNQWLPSLEAHRPTWIAPYVKGPADLPLVIKDKVNVFVR